MWAIKVFHQKGQLSFICTWNKICVICVRGLRNRSWSFRAWCKNSQCLSGKKKEKKARQLLDKPSWILYVSLCRSVFRFNNSQDSQRGGVFVWYGSLLKPLAVVPFSESGVKWLVFYWWAPEVASVGNWIFDLLEFGKYILSVWSSPGKTSPSYQHH